MDITRNWRLKTSRSHLLASRCPETGAVILPQQTATALAAHSEVYTFDVTATEATPTAIMTSRAPQESLDYVQAAR
jgi:uncharacterized OB-fold protein